MSESSERLVVVAHEDLIIRNSAARVLRRAGFEVIAVGDGESAAVLLAARDKPDALVVDVGLSEPPFYALCDQIRADGLATRVLLVASVYSRTGYKRRPQSLYGADDYIEQHHIVDNLAQKTRELIESNATRPTVHDRELESFEQVEDSRVRIAGERRLRFRHDTQDEAEVLASRLARLIVADLALYNAEEIRGWQASGSSMDALPPRLAEGLEEARRIFEERVPPELAFDHDFVTEAFLAFLNPSDR